jgi:hypothetical protein
MGNAHIRKMKSLNPVQAFFSSAFAHERRYQESIAGKAEPSPRSARRERRSRGFKKKERKKAKKNEKVRRRRDFGWKSGADHVRPASSPSGLPS